jgi:hypothetical protein
MKRSVIAAIALFLLVPSLSFAGSATSRYDVTIGGFVKFDMGYATQGVGADYTTAVRSSYHGNQNQNDEYGNIYAASGETRLNFLVKGPDGWGAKTSAFIEADFRGTQAGAAYGLFALRHAYIKMDWANTSLIMGQTWNRWGNIGTHSNIVLGVNDVGPFIRGQRQPQITVEQRFNKNWSASLGLYTPANSMGTLGGSTQVNNFTRSGMPFAEGEIVFKSDACGKIGPRNLLFGLGGYAGQEKPSYISSAAGAPTKYSDDTVTSWGVALKGFIPIIPEKKGDKTGALALSGNIFTGQDLSWFTTTFYATSYPVGTVANRHYSAPVITGGHGNLQYYFTDKFFVTGLYGYASVNFSSPFMQAAVGNVANVRTLQQAIINLSYDVNPAMRLGVEYANIYTRYANFQALGGGQFYDTKGSVNSVRVGAWYFF